MVTEIRGESGVGSEQMVTVPMGECMKGAEK